MRESVTGTSFVNTKGALKVVGTQIHGLGEVVAKNIEEEARIKPFVSIEDFQNRCKVSTTLIDKMRSLGLFKNMPESSQLSLFDLGIE